MLTVLRPFRCRQTHDHGACHLPWKQCDRDMLSPRRPDCLQVEGTCRTLGWYSAIVERADVRLGLGGTSFAVAVCRLHHVSNFAASLTRDMYLRGGAASFAFRLSKLCAACSSQAVFCEPATHASSELENGGRSKSFC